MKALHQLKTSFSTKTIAPKNMKQLKGGGGEIDNGRSFNSGGGCPPPEDD